MFPQVYVSFFVVDWIGWVFLSGQQFSEEFGKISSVRKVPVMKDGNFILTERYNGTLNASLEDGLIRKEEKVVNVPPLVLLQHCNPKVPGAETLIFCGWSLVPSRPAAAGTRKRVPVLAAHEPQESRLKGLPAQGTSLITFHIWKGGLSLLYQFV